MACHHLVHELRVAELARADIDRDGQVARSGRCAQAASCAQAVSSTQRPSGRISAGLFGQRDELGRAAPGRAAGAASAAAPPRRSCGRRRPPAAGSRAGTAPRARPGAGRPPARRWRVTTACMSGSKKRTRVAARRLGLVHGEVGLLEQFAHASRSLAEQGDADAAGAVVQVARQHVGLAQRGQDLLGHRARAGRRRPAACRRGPPAGPRIRRRPGGPRCRPSRTQARRRSATCCSSRSPLWWPSVSLRVLKLSRSMNISAPSRGRAGRPAPAAGGPSAAGGWAAGSAGRRTPGAGSSPRPSCAR